jgi:alkanesulfonate monooxygenase SsuD/methylene tetrahydromethanopterin reductase-like flavin-dependent oxidoreductase (luciferase family)
MSAYPEAAAHVLHPFDHPAREVGDTVVLFSNRFFDPHEAARLYAERQEEFIEAERAGFDGIMVNEHHNAPFSMNARCNIVSAMLAGITKRVKIVQLGNPIPLWDNPVQLAEETAMIDLLSGGRLVAGVIRGGGQEQFASNANPAFNRERFEEGHDLLVKAWTERDPFRWEGNHYQFPVVNPWAVPLQVPHPRVWVPGVRSTETIIWAAQHRYPYICLNTSEEETQRIWKIYGEEAEASGYTAGEDLRGYLMQCHVQEDEDRALANARQFQWMLGEFTGMGRPWLAAPAGYSSPESRLAQMRVWRERRGLTVEEITRRKMASGGLIAGTPKQAIERIRRWLELTRPSILLLWGNDGKISHEDSMCCIRLLGEEVIPAVREIGADLGIRDPFEMNSPVSLTAQQGTSSPSASKWARR